MTLLYYRGLIALLIVLLPINVMAQSFDFGIEVQQNYNSVEKYESQDKYHPDNLALSIVDINNDTSNIYLSKFNMANNLEIPLYLRFNWRRRWFLDMKMSHCAYNLSMEGVVNYNDQYYYDNYGTYDDYMTDANANGFPNADSTDYTNYINAAKDINESEIRTTEQFRLLNLTANAGVRFLPHKSVKMFVGMGFSVKQKFRKNLYNYIDFSNPYIHDVRIVNSGLDWYAERSTYYNIIVGAEFYRFRASAYFQTMVSYTFPHVVPFQEVVYKSPSTAFDVSSSYGFSLSANLFSVDVGKRVKKDDVSSDEIIISNIRREKDKFDLGFRYDRRILNDLTSYYELPDQKLTILDVDTVLLNDNGTFYEALDMEMVKLGAIKRIEWNGRFTGFLDIYITKRLGVRGGISGSKLTYDISSTQLKAIAIDKDSMGLQYMYAENTPRISYAVYRKKVNVVDITGDVTFKVVDRDLFSLSLWAGIGITGFAYTDLNKKGNPKGINELDIYNKFDNWYIGFDSLDFKIHQGELDMNLTDSPSELMAKVDAPGNEYDLDPQDRRFIFPSLRFGIDANIERFVVGFGMDMSFGQMDRFLLSNYSSFYMSIGYKLWSR
ncbi:MAG: hypothetical protein H6582_06390 [Crocinitomicaceae bacterium]|nr:hypothetical protein [Crocinitomicaceae bacterium]